MAAEFGIKRLDDRAVFDTFIAAKKAGDDQLSLAKAAGTLKGDLHDIQIHFSSSLPWAFTDDDIADGGSDQFCIASALINVGARPNSNTDLTYMSFELSRFGGTLFDKFRISDASSAPFSGVGEQQVLRAIHGELSRLLEPIAPEDGGLIPTLSNLANGFSTTYRAIANELSEAVTAVNKERTNQLNEFQEERARLRDEIGAERAEMLEQFRSEMESRRQQLEMDRDALKADADAEHQQLKAEWAKLEVSSHKDARRRQFAALQEELGRALTAPVADGGLRATRWAVFVAMILAGVAAGYFAFGRLAAGATLSVPGVASEAWIFPAIQSVALTVTSLASFFGAAAWLRYFYVRDLQAHEELRRFQNDMARASWVMEAALEIRKEHHEEIPPEWIAGVTEGLFAARKKDTLEEGAQALAALLGISASASFGPGGVSVELGKKAGKALATATKRDE